MLPTEAEELQGAKNEVAILQIEIAQLQRELASSRERVTELLAERLSIIKNRGGQIAILTTRAEKAEAELERIGNDKDYVFKANVANEWEERFESQQRRIEMYVEQIASLDQLVGEITICSECGGTRIPKPPRQPYCCPIGHARECVCTVCQWRRAGYAKNERITQLEAALGKLWKHTPKIDNGYCQVCRRAHRTWFFDKELGLIPNKCPDVDCLSHIVEAALAAPVAHETSGCPLCGHPSHAERCEADAPNAQFRCACAGPCGHGKHPDYCKQCEASGREEKCSALYK